MEFLTLSNVSNKLKDVIIQGFDGNDKLASHIKNFNFNTKDKYIILADMVLDNSKALAYYLDISNSIRGYNNVYLSDLLSFEYMMLRFKYFINWTEPMKIISGYEQAKPIRNKFIHCIDNGISWVTEPDIVNYIVKRKGIDTNKPGWQRELTFISSENIATLLLSTMTNGGTTEFGISKTRFGNCWYNNCCHKHNSVNGNNKCRIYKYNKTSLEKAKNLWNGTLAKQIINKL